MVVDQPGGDEVVGGGGCSGGDQQRWLLIYPLPVGLTITFSRKTRSMHLYPTLTLGPIASLHAVFRSCWLYEADGYRCTLRLLPLYDCDTSLSRMASVTSWLKVVVGGALMV